MLFGFVMAAAIVLAGEEDTIKKLMKEQEGAWNRGNIEEFVKYYDNSPAITFVGKTVSRGYDGVLARYKRNYPDTLHMGTLQFDEIEVRMLGKEYALVIGKFILTRQEAGGGGASGRYSLIARKTASGWKFIHDHTSN